MKNHWLMHREVAKIEEGVIREALDKWVLEHAFTPINDKLIGDFLQYFRGLRPVAFNWERGITFKVQTTSITLMRP